MKHKVIFISFCILFSLFIPYILTMLINGKNEEDIYEKDKLGKIIHITEGESNSKIDIEEFIPCVIISQLPIESEEELLKAQAVVIRTYILKKMVDLEEINATELDLPYVTYTQMQKMWEGEFTKNYKMINKIVEKTNHEVIKFDNQLITPYYHEASVGATRTANEIFVGEDYPYLQSVESLQDIEAKNYLSIKYFAKEELINRLKEYNSTVILDPNTLLESVVVSRKCSAGYVLDVNIGDTTMSGEEFAGCLELNSSFFSIEDYEGQIRIITKGIGHGIGLSLYGAESLARDGSSYKDIISYYYKNIILESV